jgi:hypothetical protein
MKPYYYSVLLALVCLLSFASHAKTIANCSSSSGYSYFIEGLIVPKEDAGFQVDKITDGKISLEKSGDEYKLSMIDAMGTINTVEGQGGKLISMSVGTAISIFVFYTGVVEHYMFRPDEGILTWTASRAGQLIDKHSIYVSSCDFL